MTSLFFSIFLFAGLHSTLPGISQGRPRGCAAAGQWPLPNAPYSKGPGQQRIPGTSSSIHLQLLQQCLHLKGAEWNWKETPTRTKPRWDIPHLIKVTLWSLWPQESMMGCIDPPGVDDVVMQAVHMPTSITHVKSRAILWLWALWNPKICPYACTNAKTFHFKGLFYVNSKSTWKIAQTPGWEVFHVWIIPCLCLKEGLQEALMKFLCILRQLHHQLNYFLELEWSRSQMFPCRFKPGLTKAGGLPCRHDTKWSSEITWHKIGLKLERETCLGYFKYYTGQLEVNLLF